MIPLARVRDFFAVEAAGGVLLLVATGVALAWANSPWQHGYEDLWAAGDLRHWVDEGLMAVFFLVVGLEIKRELVAGELRDRRTAALPVVAAVGGMVVPAGLYLAINAGGDGASGWGIPMATDIAFAVGLLGLLGRGLPPSLRLFLLTLAVVDDVGAILVIALAYSDDLATGWLALAAAGLVGLALLRRVGRWSVPAFLLVGLAVWAATYRSGVHATIAGAALGLLAPADRTERLERSLHPVASYFVLPVFALANAGVVLSADALADAVRSPVTIGVVAGLVVGKPVGIAAGAWLAVRLGLARLPAGTGWAQVAAVGAVAGIGFTVSLFVAGLAFDEVAGAAEATIGVLAGSLVAAVAGGVLLRRAQAP